jgi:hypothetical protein
MKKLIVATLAVLFTSSALAMQGESLDSGLGSLPSNYTAGEYNYIKKADGSVEWPFAL